MTNLYVYQSRIFISELGGLAANRASTNLKVSSSILVSAHSVKSMTDIELIILETTECSPSTGNQLPLTNLTLIREFSHF